MAMISCVCCFESAAPLRAGRPRAIHTATSLADKAKTGAFFATTSPRRAEAGFPQEPVQDVARRRGGDFHERPIS
jgi:hypothetical protein